MPDSVISRKFSTATRPIVRADALPRRGAWLKFCARMSRTYTCFGRSHSQQRPPLWSRKKKQLSLREKSRFFSSGGYSLHVQLVFGELPKFHLPVPAELNHKCHVT